MLLNVFTNLDMTNSATNTISFNGYDRVFFTITENSYSGTLSTLSFYATNDNIDVLIREFNNDEISNSSSIPIGLSFRGCPNELKVVYSSGTVTSGSLSIIANII